MPTVKSHGPTTVELIALCLDCKVRHHSHPMPGQEFVREIDEWHNKHSGHRIEIHTPRRIVPRDLDDRVFEEAGRAPWWLEYRENANIKLSYASSVALTITLASLATDTNLLAGRASTAEDNTSNLYLDSGLSGQVTTGTSPTASKEIDVYAYASTDDGPVYPDAITGTDANKTMTTANILQQALAVAGVAFTSATSNEKNWFRSVSVASLFGGFMPHKWGVFVVHNTGVNLNATGGNHFFNHKPVYATSI